ncbi:MAG: hypothetical protein U0575_00380 [Phycisphaerales bacterium]
MILESNIAISSRFAHTVAIAASCAIATFATAAASAASTFYGPLPYLCSDDSPFNLCQAGSNGYLETFEDGALNVPGVTASTGSVTGPGGITDSVDCDDGAIDGKGQQGHSFFMVPGSTGIKFTFSAAVLGGLPTFAGIVWTDGGAFNTVTFEAFGPGNVSLGVIIAPNVGDGAFNSMTAEDRFFGVSDPGGISAISIKSVPSGGGSGLEVDHLQYGFAPTCLGDLNADGTIDGADIGLLLAQWGAPGSGDLNCDGIVDGADVGLLLAGFGSCG